MVVMRKVVMRFLVRYVIIVVDFVFFERGVFVLCMRLSDKNIRVILIRICLICFRLCWELCKKNMILRSRSRGERIVIWEFSNWMRIVDLRLVLRIIVSLILFLIVLIVIKFVSSRVMVVEFCSRIVVVVLVVVVDVWLFVECWSYSCSCLLKVCLKLVCIRCIV